MKHIFTTSLLSLLFFTAMAQTSPQWTWGTIDAGIPIDINPDVVIQSVAAFKDQSLSQTRMVWAVNINKKTVINQQMGDYRFEVRDTSGNVLSSTIAIGKMSVIAMQCDQANNVYVLAKFIDTLTLSNALQLINPVGGSEYCMFRLNANGLQPQWIKQIGGDFFTSTECFTIASNSGIYYPVDSADGTRIYKANSSTGVSEMVLFQERSSYITSIQLDDQQNIYLSGVCAFNGIAFNGTLVPHDPSLDYPKYIVRYRSDGSYHWSHFMRDITCTNPELAIASDNIIYYTAPHFDTITLGNIVLPAPGNQSSYLYSRFDSLGNFIWAKSGPDSGFAQAYLTFRRNTFATDNGSLIVLLETRGALNWGNGITTSSPVGTYSGTVLCYLPDGTTKWAQQMLGGYVGRQQMAYAGGSIWVTGNAFDSTALTFPPVTVPAPGGSFAYYPFAARMRESGTTLGIADVSGVADFRVYPNPATQSFMIRSDYFKGAATVRVFNTLGMEVVNQTFLANVSQVDVSAVAKGLYFVEIRAGSGMKVEKLMIK